MSSSMQFFILWGLTGSPVMAALLMLGVWAVADWYTFGFARRLFRAWGHWRRGQELTRSLAVNPHDRKARADLGEILVAQGRYRRAIEILKPLVQADAEDLRGLALLGHACLGAGHAEQGELLLKELEASHPDYGHGFALLELGRWRLRRGDAAAAEEALTRYLRAHPRVVEGHVLRARALEALGNREAAKAERETAWREHVTGLPYERRHSRLWAWRVQPWRPALYAVLLIGALLVAGSVLSGVRGQYGDAQAAESAGGEE